MIKSWNMLIFKTWGEGPAGNQPRGVEDTPPRRQEGPGGPKNRDQRKNQPTKGVKNYFSPALRTQSGRGCS